MISIDDAARKKTYADLMQELKHKYLVTQGTTWEEPDCGAL